MPTTRAAPFSITTCSQPPGARAEIDHPGAALQDLELLVDLLASCRPRARDSRLPAPGAHRDRAAAGRPTRARIWRASSCAPSPSSPSCARPSCGRASIGAFQRRRPSLSSSTVIRPLPALRAAWPAARRRRRRAARTAARSALRRASWTAGCPRAGRDRPRAGGRTARCSKMASRMAMPGSMSSDRPPARHGSFARSSGVASRSRCIVCVKLRPVRPTRRRRRSGCSGRDRGARRRGW